MKKKRLYLVVGLVAMMTLLVPGCAKAPEVAPLKIGTTLSLSGPAASITLPALDGARMIIEEVNARGGLLYGGTRHPVVLISYDGKWDTSTMVKAARKLVFEDKVAMIIQDAMSAGALASQEITEPNKVITDCWGWAKDLLGPDKPYSFRSCPTSYETGWALWKWCREKGYPEAKTMASIGPDYVTSREYADIQKAAVAQYGFTMVYEELYAKGITDFYPMLTPLIAKKPDIVELNSAGPDVFPLLKQLRELGYWGPVITVGTQAPAAAIELCGADVAEGYTAQGFEWTTAEGVLPVGQDFYNRCVDRFGSHTNQCFGYEALWYYFQAVEGANSIDPDKVKEWLENNTLNSLWGPVKYGGAAYYGIGHQMLSLVGLVGVVDGEVKQIYVGIPALE